MIEEKLIERGVNKGEIERFAKLSKHNAKKDLFRFLCDRNNWDDFSEDESFSKKLAEVLSELAVKDFPELSPENNKGQVNYLGEEKYKLFIAQKVAIKMLGTLCENKNYKQWDFSVTLDRIYEDTLRQSKHLYNKK